MFLERECVVRIEVVPDSFPMLLLLDTYRDPRRSQILTTTGVRSAFTLVMQRRSGKHSQFGEVFLSSSLVLRVENRLEYLFFHCESLGLMRSACL